MKTKYSCVKNIGKGHETMKFSKTVSGSIRLGKNEHYEKNAVHTLRNELSKGIQSMKNGDVYTIDEAWKEIDEI